MKKRFFFAAISVLSFYSCGYDIVSNYDMLLINKSDRGISLLYSNDVNPQLTENNVAYYLSDQSATKPDSSLIISKLGGKNAWHDYIEEGRTKRLYFYIFETDTLKKYNNVFSMYDLVV